MLQLHTNVCKNEYKFKVYIYIYTNSMTIAAMDNCSQDRRLY